MSRAAGNGAGAQALRNRAERRGGDRFGRLRRAVSELSARGPASASGLAIRRDNTGDVVPERAVLNKTRLPAYVRPMPWGLQKQYQRDLSEEDEDRLSVEVIRESVAGVAVTDKETDCDHDHFCEHWMSPDEVAGGRLTLEWADKNWPAALVDDLVRAVTHVSESYFPELDQIELDEEREDDEAGKASPSPGG